MMRALRLAAASALTVGLIALQIDPALAHNGEAETPGHVLRDMAWAGGGIVLLLTAVLLLFWLRAELRRRTP